MLSSDLRALYESYQTIYDEEDQSSSKMIEEIVEELVVECLEFGYTLDEASEAIEEAFDLYFDEKDLEEAKVTYGSDTESPEQRRERAKAKVGEKRAAARKAAVKTAVGRAKASAAGAAAGAGIAASIAKDTARRAARTAAHKVTYSVQKKKAEVKSGVKSLLGKGLRKAAGAVGKVAQKAAGAASRLGEEVEQVVEAKKTKKMKGEDPCWKGYEMVGTKKKGGKEVPNCVPKEEMEMDTWDVVLEYLITNGHADTNSEALYLMSQLDEEMIENIIETRMDPRGRPASGPMNVYRQSKPNTDPAFQAALKSHREKEAKKTPEQRKAELDAYIERQRNK